MTSDHLEQQLRELGEQWPSDESFVECVVSRIDCDPPPASVRVVSGRRLLRAGCVTIGAIIVCVGLWWLTGWQSSGSILYAQVKDAFRQVQTMHEVATIRTDDGRMQQFSETWFVRGKGFSVVRDDLVRVDNGVHFWEYRTGSKAASRTQSLGTDEMLDQALNLREQLERDCERYAEGDRRIDGMLHECYRLTYHGQAKPADPAFLDFDRRRSLIFINPESLPARAEMAEKIGGEWKTRVVRTWEYDVPVDPEVLEPQFAEGVRVIDIDEAFEQLTAIENAVHTEVREGLTFSIHRAKRFEHGGVMILSSVRGTDETLREYPLTRRMLQPGLYYTDGPATNYAASPQGSGFFRLSLARANHQGIDLEWWMMVPRGQPPNWFVDIDGRVQLKVGMTPQGEYAEANHADENGVIHHIDWDLSLDIPEPNPLPSLDEIAVSVHSDLSLLRALIFPGRLNLGVTDVNGTPTSQFGSAEDVSPKEFAQAVREHWLWWDRGDVDFQLKRGATSYGTAIGARMKPAVIVDHNLTVDDDTLARATKRSNLAVISARGTRVTDAGLAHLTALGSLRSLNVADTSVTDDGLRHIESIKSLVRIDVTGTLATPAGIERLKTALPDAVIVTSDNDSSTRQSASDNDGSTKQPANVAESSAGPQALPSRVAGIVIDTDDQPVASAQVTVLIRTFEKDLHEELTGPLAWTAVTDDEGRYSISPTGAIHPGNEVRVRVVADGYADLSDRDHEKNILSGTISDVRMLAGRRISGRLVDDLGNSVSNGIVRFQSCDANFNTWDSGPLPVSEDGRFSLSLPSEGTAVGAVYPTGFAPRFVEVTGESDQGDIVLEEGVALKGRVVDRNGEGVARTVVEIRNSEYRRMHALTAVIGTAVRTDELGYFRLPSLSGAYTLSVGRSVPDFSRQMMLDGETPPEIAPLTIECDASRPGEDILLREVTH